MLCSSKRREGKGGRRREKGRIPRKGKRKEGRMRKEEERKEGNGKGGGRGGRKIQERRKEGRNTIKERKQSNPFPLYHPHKFSTPLSPVRQLIFTIYDIIVCAG